MEQHRTILPWGILLSGWTCGKKVTSRGQKCTRPITSAIIRVAYIHSYTHIHTLTSNNADISDRVATDSSIRLHFSSPPPPNGVRGQAWIEKFVLNLCDLCFKIPEFVLLPTPRDKLIGLGEGAEEMLALPKWGMSLDTGSQICASFVLFVLQTLRIFAFILHPLS